MINLQKKFGIKPFKIARPPTRNINIKPLRDNNSRNKSFLDRPIANNPSAVATGDLIDYAIALGESGKLSQQEYAWVKNKLYREDDPVSVFEFLYKLINTNRLTPDEAEYIKYKANIVLG